MREKKETFRHELKYVISNEQRDVQIARMKDILYLDPYAGSTGYKIRSLYFDDFNNSAYEDKLIGIANRKKYRIRIYNGGDKVIKLECKQKQGNYILKESVGLTREEVYQLLEGRFEFLLQYKEPLYHKFYVACVSEILRPKVIVDYDRIPYLYDTGTVRVTFDSHVCAGVGSFDLFDQQIPTIEVMTADRLIMEVKYTEYLPQVVKSILMQDSGEYTAASKYCMCYEEKERFQ